ncbi:phospholipase D family protein [Helicobacter bizzozeronii]|uniref:phospholipase D family protein n=1 Tax=Helicobacter bizzozeronii TaxID=56877 RepID=UPI000CF1C040
MLAFRVVWLLCALLFSGCLSTIVKKNSTYPTYSLELYNPLQTPIAQPYAAILERDRSKSLGFLLLDGKSALLQRIALIRMATHNIDIQTYIYKNDISSRVMMSELYKAANRGVKVRLLIDDNGLDSDMSDIIMLNTHPNIDVKIFNPYRVRHRGLRYLEMIVSYDRIKKRMHNKLFIVDNVALVIGGRNIADVYFDNDLEENFLDMDALFLGQVGLEAKKSFLEYWNYKSAIPANLLPSHHKLKKYAKTYAHTLSKILHPPDQQNYNQEVQDFIQDFIHKKNTAYYGTASFIADNPSKINAPAPHSPIKQALGHILAHTTNSLYIASSYLIPGHALLKTFKKKLQEGLELNILTNSLSSTDAIVVYGAWERYAKKLVKAGANVYETKNDFFKYVKYTSKGIKYKIKGRLKNSLHSKILIFDGRKTWIGSFNLDARSAQINTESVVIFDNSTFATHLQSLMQEQMQESWHLVLEKRKLRQHLVWEGVEGGQVIRHTKPPNTSPFLRFIKNWSKILPEDEL